VLHSEIDDPASCGGPNPLVEGLREVVNGRREVRVGDMCAKSVNHSATLSGRKRQKTIQCCRKVGASRLAARLVHLPEPAKRRMHTQVAVFA
jgi:hypothetical protein